MSDYKRLEERNVSYAITDEFLSHYCGIKDRNKQEKLLGEYVVEFEQTYAAVCDMERNTGTHAYMIEAYYSTSANRREIERGLKDIQARLSKDYAHE